MRSESDLKPDDEISGTNSEPLTTADVAASRARLGLGRGCNVASQSEPVIVVSRNEVAAGRATAERIERSADGQEIGQNIGQEQEMGPLLPGDDVARFRERWENIQVGFVDEPRSAVEQADHLLTHTMHRLAETFAKERENLEHQWDRRGEVSTEDLRLALRRYRTFFGRLMQV
jgi:hypothetical protein